MVNIMSFCVRRNGYGVVVFIIVIASADPGGHYSNNTNPKIHRVYASTELAFSLPCFPCFGDPVYQYSDNIIPFHITRS